MFLKRAEETFSKQQGSEEITSSAKVGKSLECLMQGWQCLFMWVWRIFGTQHDSAVRVEHESVVIGHLGSVGRRFTGGGSRKILVSCWSDVRECEQRRDPVG